MLDVDIDFLTVSIAEDEFLNLYTEEDKIKFLKKHSIFMNFNKR